MQENVGRVDRIARSIVGPALVGWGYGQLGGREGRPAGLLALVGGSLLIESAITRVCPISALVGLDTRSKYERRRDRQRAQARALSPGPATQTCNPNL